MYNKFFRLFYFNCVFAVLPLMAHAELSTREAWENTKRILETGGYQVFGEEVFQQLQSRKWADRREALTTIIDKYDEYVI